MLDHETLPNGGSSAREHLVLLEVEEEHPERAIALPHTEAKLEPDKIEPAMRCAAAD